LDLTNNMTNILVDMSSSCTWVW